MTGERTATPSPEFTLAPDEALERLGVDAKTGLGTDEVASRT